MNNTFPENPVIIYNSKSQCVRVFDGETGEQIAFVCYTHICYDTDDHWTLKTYHREGAGDTVEISIDEFHIIFRDIGI